jgi:protein-S-isoprenylcysteine O-methyltransferase Ste14
VESIALLLAALGFALTWWARIHLGRFWSAAVTLKAEHTLIRSGPYALTRHPIYTGLLLALLATAVARDSLGSLIGAGLILLGLVLKLRQEEQFLKAQFGAAYDAYKKDVPTLIPRPW